MSAMTGRTDPTAWHVDAAAATRGAQADVLLVCADARRRHEYTKVLERRGLRVSATDDCRAGITSTAKDNLEMAVIIADLKDHYTGPLISALWSRERSPEIWLIGNPYALRLSEVIAGRNVTVLPPTTDAELFERVQDALDHPPHSANGAAPVQRERSGGHALRMAIRSATRFDIPGLRDVFPRPMVEPL